MARAQTKNVLVRFPPETYAAAKVTAFRLGLSLNKYIVLVTDADVTRVTDSLGNEWTREPENP